MLSNSNQLYFNIGLVIFLSTTFIRVNALQCYVCGGDAISCEKFNQTSHIFVQECPPEAHSCSIQTQGHNKTRSCELMRIEDCETANNVMYCYCSKSLCNGNYINFSHNDDDDDEDRPLEGSGISHLPTNINNITPKRNSSITNVSSHLQIHFHKAYVLILALLCY